MIGDADSKRNEQEKVFLLAQVIHLCPQFQTSEEDIVMNKKNTQTENTPYSVTSLKMKIWGQPSPDRVEEKKRGVLSDCFRKDTRIT